MSVSCCLQQSLRIARTPRSTWRDQLDQLPESCQHPNVCTGGVGCRQRNFDYLSGAAKAADIVAKARERKEAAAALTKLEEGR